MNTQGVRAFRFSARATSEGGRFWRLPKSSKVNWLP